MLERRPFNIYFSDKLSKIVLSNLCMVLLLTNYCFSQGVVTLSDPQIVYEPRQEVSYLWDKEKKLHFQDILTPSTQSKFQFAGKVPISLGLTHWDMWFMLKVKNTIPDKEKEWILELSYPHYDSLEFYFKDDKGEWQRHLTGDLTPFKTRKIFNRNFAYPLNIPDTSERTFFIHVSGQGSLQFPLFIQNRDSFYAAQEKINLIYGGVIFGIMSIMLLYNLFIFFSLRDKVYLYYVFTNTCLLLFYFANSGYGYQYIWGNYPWINSRLIPFAIMISGLTCTIFARSFLNSKKYVPFIDKIFKGIIIGYLVGFVLLGLLDYEWLIRFTSLLAGFGSVLLLFTSYRVWMRGNRYARFMALAFTFYLIGVVLLTFNTGGYLSRNFFVTHCIEMGTLIEITMLSFALSDKYSMYRKEKEIAQAELIDMQRKINEELEKKVEKRTLKISEQKSELQEMNRVKDKLLSIISHDLKGPLNSFQSLLSMMMKDELTPEKINMYTLHLNNKLGSMVSLVDNILHWVRSQMNGIKLDIQKTDLKDLIEENVSLFQSQSELKNITLIDEVSKNTWVMGDKNIIRLVIRNLLSNALKFTPEGGKIYISSKPDGGNIVTEIKDTGVGIDKEAIAKLFSELYFSTPDTSKNQGTGLGLLLCKEFLSRTSGKIWVESEVDKGATFKFTQPRAIAEMKIINN
jgi:two-component system, sensor histidine kinase LadS